MFNYTHLLLAGCLLLMEGCSNRNNQTDQDKLDVTLDTTTGVTLELSGNAEEDILFYNMLYPIDLGVLIDKRNTYFNSNLLNPLNNIIHYNESSKRALALGVYGADLSYLWGFNQSQQALSYFAAIKQLANDLGLPYEYVSSTANKAEMYTDNIDTLVSIARRAYYDCDTYLIKSNQQDLAVLVLLGGWIETMHTALHLYNQPNSRMACKIISQKYALTSLLNLLYQQPENMVITNYSNKLIGLLEEFDRLQNNYFTDHLDVDTLNKTITFNATKELELNPDEFKLLKDIVTEIRTQIIQ
jgi:hypothetical protein